VIVVVTDGSGSLVDVERMDGVQYASVDVAIKKALSAAAYRRSTKDFADLHAQGGIANRFLVLLHAMPVEGGLPVVIDGKVVGAIGASGITAQQEGQVAASGLAAPK
jgi:glc operon protein GlcG